MILTSRYKGQLHYKRFFPCEVFLNLAHVLHCCCVFSSFVLHQNADCVTICLAAFWGEAGRSEAASALLFLFCRVFLFLPFLGMRFQFEGGWCTCDCSSKHSIHPCSLFIIIWNYCIDAWERARKRQLTRLPSWPPWWIAGVWTLATNQPTSATEFQHISFLTQANFGWLSYWMQTFKVVLSLYLGRAFSRSSLYDHGPVFFSWTSMGWEEGGRTGAVEKCRSTNRVLMEGFPSRPQAVSTTSTAQKTWWCWCLRWWIGENDDWQAACISINSNNHLLDLLSRLWLLQSDDEDNGTPLPCPPLCKFHGMVFMMVMVMVMVMPSPVSVSWDQVVSLTCGLS